MENLLFSWSNDNAILMLQLAFFFSVMSFIMCFVLFYKRHKDDVSKRIPKYNPFEEHGEVVGEATDSPVGKHIPTSSPYIIVIKNTTNEFKRCNLFGFGKNIFSKNFGSDEGVEVKMLVSNIDYLFMLIQSAFQPFETGLIRLSSKNVKQLSQIITITSKDANGQLCQVPIITHGYVKPDGIGMFVDVDGNELKEDDDKYLDVHYMVKVDMSTDLDIQILPNTELHFVVYPINKFNATRTLGRFMGMVKEYASPTVTKN